MSPVHYPGESPILVIRAQTVQSRLTVGDILHSHVHPEEKNPVCHELLENLWPSGGRFGAELAKTFLRIKTKLRRKKDLKQNYVFTHFFLNTYLGNNGKASTSFG